MPKIKFGTRIAPSLFDHIFMCIIIGILLKVAYALSILQLFKVTHDLNEPSPLITPGIIAIAVCVTIYFSKDSFNGRSLAKRIFKLQVVNHSTGKPASPLRCFLRNIFGLGNPLCYVLGVRDLERLFGDLVAHTRVEYYTPAEAKGSINYFKVAYSFIISSAAVFAVTLVFQLLPGSGEKNIHPVQSSYNEAESKQLAQLYADSLGDYGTADVRVYDTTSKPNVKFVSVILYLKNEPPEENSQPVWALMYKAVALWHGLLPEEASTGNIQAAYITSFSTRKWQYPVRYKAFYHITYVSPPYYYLCVVIVHKSTA